MHKLLAVIFATVLTACANISGPWYHLDIADQAQVRKQLDLDSTACASNAWNEPVSSSVRPILLTDTGNVGPTKFSGTATTSVPGQPSSTTSFSATVENQPQSLSNSMAMGLAAGAMLANSLPKFDRRLFVSCMTLNKWTLNAQDVIDYKSWKSKKAAEIIPSKPDFHSEVMAPASPTPIPP